jgi:hypothetical protein
MLAYPIVLRYVLDWLRYQEVMLPRKAQDAAWFMQFDDVRVYAYFSIALLFVALCICHVIENSRFGLALRAIKENEQAAAAAGINIWSRKMVATAISGAMAGAAGGLYVVVIRVAVPADVFGLHVSARRMVVTLFGGVGTLWGPLIGSAFLIPLGDGLHAVLGHTIPGSAEHRLRVRADSRDHDRPRRSVLVRARSALSRGARAVRPSARPEVAAVTLAAVDSAGVAGRPAAPLVSAEETSGSSSSTDSASPFAGSKPCRT